MEAEFIVSAIIPTSDGREEIHLAPKSTDMSSDLTTVWILRRSHGLQMGENVIVGRWS